MSSQRQATSSPLSHTMQTRKTTWEQFIQPERQKAFPNFAASSPQLSAALGFSPNMSSGSPFVNSPHGHPGFTPSKVGGRSTAASDGRNQKQPKPPEKPLMPYMRYSRKVWEQVRGDNADMKVYDIGKLIGQMWRDLPAEQKQEYADEYELEKMEYNQLLRAYHDSPAYQLWINSKSAKPTDNEKSKKFTGFQSPQKPQDGKISLQTVDDDEELDEFSQKHVAAGRYMRNHRLVNEIFSDVVVPDVRSVVMTNRMHVLKRQVQSLTNHQKKLEAELAQIEEKFETKKRRFLDASETFQKEMRERCEAKLVDAQKYQKMIDKAVEEIRSDMEKARQLREEQAVIQKMEEAKREAEAAAQAASHPPPETLQVHDDAARTPNGGQSAAPPHPCPPTAHFLESHDCPALPDALAEKADVPDFRDQSNLPDIAGTDSLTNDSSATSCSQSQESLPPDAAAAHDPAMDEDTDQEDTLDESLDEAIGDVSTEGLPVPTPPLIEAETQQPLQVMEMGVPETAAIAEPTAQNFDAVESPPLSASVQNVEEVAESVIKAVETPLPAAPIEPESAPVPKAESVSPPSEPVIAQENFICSVPEVAVEDIPLPPIPEAVAPPFANSPVAIRDDALPIPTDLPGSTEVAAETTATPVSEVIRAQQEEDAKAQGPVPETAEAVPACSQVEEPGKEPEETAKPDSNHEVVGPTYE